MRRSINSHASAGHAHVEAVQDIRLALAVALARVSHHYRVPLMLLLLLHLAVGCCCRCGYRGRFRLLLDGGELICNENRGRNTPVGLAHAEMYYG